MAGMFVFLGFVLVWLAVWAGLSIEAHPWLLDGRYGGVSIHRQKTPLRFWTLVSAQGLVGLAVVVHGLAT